MPLCEPGTPAADIFVSVLAHRLSVETIRPE